MTLSEIGLLLHYYYSPEEHPDIESGGKGWVRQGLASLIHFGLVAPRQVRCESGSSYEVLERGSVYVKAIQAVPLPVQVWVIPDAGDISQEQRP
jgi:hypothetical protein